jgi:DNA-binding response OmpR family regulator
MPQMDGYEVCRRLKELPRLREVPVIFASALSEPLDRAKALAAGAVDYVTKPIRPDEVSARVGAHLAVRRLKLELERARLELAQARARVKELEARDEAATARTAPPP